MVCIHVGRISLKKPCLITGFLDCCRLFTTRGGKPQSKAESPHSNLVQKLILYACDRNGEAYDGNGKHGSDSICQNITMSIDSLRVYVVLLHEDTLRPMHDCTCSDKRGTSLHSISNDVRRSYELRAGTFANSGFGVGRVFQACGQSRHCSLRRKTNAGSLGLRQT